MLANESPESHISTSHLSKGPSDAKWTNWSKRHLDKKKSGCCGAIISEKMLVSKGSQVLTKNDFLPFHFS